MLGDILEKLKVFLITAIIQLMHFIIVRDCIKIETPGIFVSGLHELKCYSGISILYAAM